MSKLRESARGQECHLRLPGVCNFDPETTVLAHINRVGISGVGQKPPDVCGVFACSACHDVIDRRAKSLLDAFERDTYLFEGHLRTLAYWDKEGLI